MDTATEPFPYTGEDSSVTTTKIVTYTTTLTSEFTMARSDRKRLFTGVYQDAAGVSIIVSVRGTPREFRKDEHGKPYGSYERHALRDARKKIQAREQLIEERAVADASTFAADVARFLQTLSPPKHRKNNRSYMNYWIRLFPDRDRNTLTPVEIQTAYATITKGDSTRRHVRRALIKFYETLNGKEGYNPARTLIAPPKAQAEARAIPYAIIEKIFAALVPSRARARLKVIAYVGLPHQLIAKLQPSDLRLQAKEVIVHPRRKGAGVEGRAIPLSKAGVEALTEFRDLNAFGSFQTAQLVRTFRLGAARAKVTLPENARPYDLRHSFLTEIYRQTGDLYAVSELGMHATLEQTARYAKGAATERATKAIGAVPRFGATSRPGKSPKVSRSLQGKRAAKKVGPRGRNA